MSLWLVFHAFRLVTGKEGMGYGDFKLFAALGAWLGWKMLPLVIVLSAATGAVLGISMIVLRGRDRGRPHALRALSRGRRLARHDVRGSRWSTAICALSGLKH